MATEVNIDLQNLVNRVADRFEAASGFHVGDRARHELIQPALPYSSHVAQELQKGSISIEFLESSIFTVLQNAQLIAKEWGRNSIGEDTTRESMKRYCPYLFWC